MHVKQIGLSLMHLSPAPRGPARRPRRAWGAGLLALGLSPPAAAARVLVGFSGDGPPSSALEAAGAAGVRCWSRARLCVADLPPARAQALGRAPGVRYVEPDRRLEVAGHPAPPSVATAGCPDPWEMDAIGAEAAWAALGHRGAGAPVIAVQDSGFLLTHLDLAGRVSGQFDYGDLDPVPEVAWSAGVPGHGTFIAGLLVADADNAVGRAGVAPEARLNLQKIADSTGALYLSYAVAAMADLADGDLGVGVLSYSLASGGASAALDDAVDALGAADILLVAAAGNCGWDDCPDADNDLAPLYPASHAGAHVLAVAGTLRDGSLNPWSHYGEASVDLGAPGVELCSLGVDSDEAVTVGDGTSYATPLVAGVAALVRGAWPRLRAADAAAVLRASAAPHPGLAGKVASGGGLWAPAALSSPRPVLERPPEDLRFGEQVDLELVIDNLAAAADFTLVLSHPPGLQIEALDGDLDVVPFSADDLLELPGSAPRPAGAAGARVHGRLAEGAARAVPLRLRAGAAVAGPLHVRVEAPAPGGAALRSPEAGAGADPGGAPAWVVQLVAAGAGDTGGPAADSGPVGGSSDGDGADGGAADGTGAEKAGCAAAGGPSGRAPALPLAVGALLLAARGRRRGPPAPPAG
jgi:hypothetical protein